MFTLKDAKNLSQDKLTNYVIDEFRKSPFLDAMVFDDTATPGGQSMSYGYNRITTLPTAAGRKIGEEYAAQETKTTPIMVLLKVFGGKFAIDRVLAKYERKLVNHVQFQLQQKIQATRALMQDWAINGDSAVDETAFDGLDKALTGSSTERTATLDLSDAAKIKADWPGLVYEINQTLKLMDGAPTVILVNSDLFAVLQTVADYSTQFTKTVNDLGVRIVKWGTATIMDMGDKPGTSTPIIPTDATAGTTDMYFVRIGLDGVHGVTPDGQTAPATYLPNMAAPGAVKTGEVEMVAALAIKATRAAAVLRGIQVAAATPSA